MGNVTHLTMRPHNPRSLRPTERWLHLQVLLAYHETSIRDHYGRSKGGSSFRYSWLTMRPPFAIITADRKVAPASGTLGLSWDLHSRSLWPTERWLQLQVLLACHETSIRDHYDRPKGGSSFMYSWLTMRPPFAIIMADRKVAPTSGTLGLPWDLHPRSLHQEVYKHLCATPRGL